MSSASDKAKLFAKNFSKNSNFAELFNKCLNESYFLDCWKFPVFRNVGKWTTTKRYHSVSLFSVVSKVFEKLVNNRIVDHLEKCGLFLISDMVFSRSTADLLTFVSGGIGRAVNSLGLLEL